MKKLIVVLALAFGSLFFASPQAEAAPARCWYEYRQGSVMSSHRYPAGVACDTRLKYRRVAKCQYLVWDWTYYGPWKSNGAMSSTVAGSTCKYSTQFKS